MTSLSTLLAASACARHLCLGSESDNARATGRESRERSAAINTAVAKHVYCSIQPPHWRLPRQILLEDVVAVAVGVAALCFHLQAMAMPPVALLWPPKPHYRSRLFGSSPRRYVHHLPPLMRSASCGGQADGPCVRVCFSVVVDSKPTQAVENVVCGEDVGGARGQRDEGGRHLSHLKGDQLPI